MTPEESDTVERDAWESGGIMIERHGALAAIEAAKMAHLYQASGDIDMQRAWLRVTRAVAAITETEGVGN